MNVFPAALLVLLLCRQPGRGRAQDEDSVEDSDYDNYEDEESKLDSSDRGWLQCYSCESLRREAGCNQTQNCLPSETFCKTLIYQESTEFGPMTTYSMWCADTCMPVSRKVDETVMTQTCCQTILCNIPPWQDNRAGGPQGSPETVAATLLLSLLTGLWAMRS